MDELIIDGVIDISENPISEEDITYRFIDWVESNNWYFGGGIRKTTFELERKTKRINALLYIVGLNLFNCFMSKVSENNHIAPRVVIWVAGAITGSVIMSFIKKKQ